MYFSGIISLLFFSCVLASTVSMKQNKKSNRNLWKRCKIYSVINDLDEISKDYQPTAYSEFMKISIQSMLHYNPQVVLSILIKKSIFFNVFFWSMFSGTLDGAEFPPNQSFSSSTRDNILKLRIAESIESIRGAISSGLIPESEISRKIIASLETFGTVNNSP